ncbi:hypothetical protein MA16_Dca025401 [Dendrobium catenatum]|uniref:Uncharacterized protein n=1 Tax=Dendrobium catenatum TaxID=906689 RepID=A0A2I0XFW1_9ASPA|nr:hypothetical protein MA16_Dca025401 [Dendrobium catenatum]
MRLLKWSPDFDINSESPICPAWISLPNLRIHFYNHTVLQAIGSIFGRPLQVDQATANRSRPSVARILVEMDITKECPKEIWLGSEINGYTQKVEIEIFPIFCSHCKLHGHDTSNCFILNPSLKNKTQNNGNRENGFTGSNYTWNNNRLWQRLDRILFNQHWISNWPLTVVEHLFRSLLDHCPLLISIKNNDTNIKGTSFFRFQNLWLQHSDFFQLVSSNWNNCIAPDTSVKGMIRFWLKIKRLNQSLNWWNKHHVKNIFANIKELEERVCYLENLLSSDPLVTKQLNDTKEKLIKFQDMEETFWRQKASAKHLNERDRNTKYFHALVNKKKSLNFINKVKDENGN